MKILFCGPDITWSQQMKDYLVSHSFESDTCTYGKDCQLFVYREKYESVILDINTENHSCLDVIKYIRLNHPKIKVILTFKDQEQLKDYESILKKLGISDYLVHPCSPEKLLRTLERDRQLEEWKKIKASPYQKDEEVVNARDEEFTRIKIDSFYKGNTTIYDHYIRLSPNTFVKILHQGDFFDATRIQKYAREKNVEFLYFKTKDRSIYVNFMNDLISKSINSSSVSSKEKMGAIKSVTEKYIEEIYITGLKPELIEEGKKISDNMFRLIEKDKKLMDIMKSYEDYDPPSYSHLFLTSFFSAIICKGLDWGSVRTIETVSMGALLHDIGKLKLPRELKDKKISDMKIDQLTIFQQHPRFGAEMLSKFPNIGEPVRQIVYQHHEWVNGMGFPNKLSGSKIYPLAKIVSLANEFSSYIIEKRITPMNALRVFIPNKEVVLRYDPKMVKCLISSFMEIK